MRRRIELCEGILSRGKNEVKRSRLLPIATATVLLHSEGGA